MGIYGRDDNIDIIEGLRARLAEEKRAHAQAVAENKRLEAKIGQLRMALRQYADGYADGGLLAHNALEGE